LRPCINCCARVAHRNPLTVLSWLLQVSRYLALVCVIKEEYFLKRSLLDYNINCLRKSLDQVLSESADY
jgi:hypothetical protein